MKPSDSANIHSPKPSKYYETFLPEQILATSPVLCDHGLDIEVHMLICHRHVTMAVWSLKTYSCAMGGLPPLMLHDDGSLTDDDITILKTIFPNSIIILEKAVTAHREFQSWIAAYDCVYYWRRTVDSCLARKLLDFVYFATRPYIVAFDPDVLFFRQSRQLAQCLSQKLRFASTDCIEAYYPPSQDLVRIFGASPKFHANSGLWGADRTTIDIQRIEHFLSTVSQATGYDFFDWTHFWLEQTILACLLSKSEPFTLLQVEQHSISFKKIGPSTCSHHYTNGGSRKLYFRAGLRYLDQLGILPRLGINATTLST